MNRYVSKDTNKKYCSYFFSWKLSCGKFRFLSQRNGSCENHALQWNKSQRQERWKEISSYAQSTMTVISGRNTSAQSKSQSVHTTCDKKLIWTADSWPQIPQILYVSLKTNFWQHSFSNSMPVFSDPPAPPPPPRTHNNHQWWMWLQTGRRKWKQNRKHLKWKQNCKHLLSAWSQRGDAHIPFSAEIHGRKSRGHTLGSSPTDAHGDRKQTVASGRLSVFQQ